MANYAALARRCQHATWASLGALLIVIAIDTVIVPSNGRSPNAVVWLLLSVPLLMVVPGLRRDQINSYAWLCFISLLYFAQSVTALFAPWRRWVDGAQLALSVALFIVSMLAVRYIARAKRAVPP